MGILRSMAGMVQVEVTSADLPGLFGAMADGGILFFDAVQQGDLTSCFTVYRRDYRRLKVLCGKRGDSLKLKSRRGLYWTAKGLLKRPVLVLGMLLLLALALFLPTRVLFIQVEGNGSVSTNLILEAAEESGICFGASRREVRSERVKNALLEAVPQLQWAGVNTYGCVAVISVRERAVPESARTETGYGNIVALRDGVVTSATAVRGNLLCAPGQAVKEGEVLISGYQDCGICIRAVQAEGEVYGRTKREIDAVMPSEYESRSLVTGQTRKISVLIGKKRINLWKDSGISDSSCGRMYEEYYVTLPGGFCLPLALCVETFSVYETAKAEMEQEEAERILTDFGADYLGKQMVAGSIRGSELLLYPETGRYRLAGEYDCIEMIGKMQREQIGE